MKTKHIALILLLIFAAAALCSCGAKEDYPVLQAVSIADRTLTTDDYNNITAAYDENEWVMDESMGMYAIYYMPAMEEDFTPNVNIGDTNEDLKALTPKIIDEINESQEALLAQNGTNILNAKKMLFNDQLISVLECETKVTDATIDFLIEQGMLTEEMIEMLGGREPLIAASSCRQTLYYAIVDGSLVIVTGSYDIEEVHKDAVLEQMNILLQTMTVN